jgi:hypothetical protein
MTAARLRPPQKAAPDAATAGAEQFSFEMALTCLPKHLSKVELTKDYVAAARLVMLPKGIV